MLLNCHTETARSTWNFNTLYRMVTICGRLLFWDMTYMCRVFLVIKRFS